MRLDADTCRSRFAAARHAYLATADPDGVPHVVPVTFALVTAGTGTDPQAQPADEIIVAVDHKPKSTRDLKRLRNLAENPRATFLVDRYDDDWTHLWWVRADAIAAVEHAEVEHADRGHQHRTAALDALAARYPQYRERRPDGPLIRARVTRWTGWAHERPGS